MTLQLTLPTEMERRLQHEAQRRGLAKEETALRLLDQHLPPPLDQRRASAIALLEQWTKEDAILPDEELASNAELLHRLDEDRPSYRRLFADLGKEKAT